MGFRGGGGGYHGFAMGGEEENRTDKSNDLQLAARMFKYTLRYKRRVALMFIAVMATTLLNLVPPLLYGAALDTYIPNLDARGLLWVALGYILVVVSTFAAQYTQNYMLEWLFGRMEYDLRTDIFDHLQRISLRFYADKDVGGNSYPQA